jgi:ribosomal protein L37AE/L43A
MTKPRTIEMVWECPECGTQLAHMTGYDVFVPVCEVDHDPAEMEQRLAVSWRGGSGILNLDD